MNVAKCQRTEEIKIGIKHVNNIDWQNQFINMTSVYRNISGIII